MARHPCGILVIVLWILCGCVLLARFSVSVYFSETSMLFPKNTHFWGGSLKRRIESQPLVSLDSIALNLDGPLEILTLMV